MPPLPGSIDAMMVGTDAVSAAYVGEDLVWSSDSFDPASLTAPLRLLLDSREITGLADGANVNSWPDTSGNADDAAAIVNHAVYKTGIYNGQPCVRFNGTQLLAAAFGESLSQPNTVVLIANQTSVGDFYFTDGLDGSNRHAIASGLNGTPDMPGIYAGGVVEAASALPLGLHMWTGVFDGASSKLYRDATLFASGNAGAQPLTGLSVGARFNGLAGMTGDWLVALVYDGALSAGDVAYLHDGYATIFGL